MKELIERKAALDLLCHYCKQPCDHVVNCAQWYAINSLDAEPVKHGHWITHNEGNPFEIYGECSICGCGQSISEHLNYCPDCGAIMDEFRIDI